MDEAACSSPDVDPEWFYSISAFDRPDLTEAQRRDKNDANFDNARAVCAGCPIQQECREANLTDPYGIFGGLTPRQREPLLKERGLAFDAPPLYDEAAVERALNQDQTAVLHKHDRVEAVRRLSHDGLGPREIAERLGQTISERQVARILVDKLGIRQVIAPADRKPVTEPGRCPYCPGSTRLVKTVNGNRRVQCLSCGVSATQYLAA